MVVENFEMKSLMTNNRFLLTSSKNTVKQLSKGQLHSALSIRDFILGPDRTNPTQSLGTLSELIVEAGIPLDRCVSIANILHADSAAMIRKWESDLGLQNFRMTTVQQRGPTTTHPL